MKFCPTIKARHFHRTLSPLDNHQSSHAAVKHLNTSLRQSPALFAPTPLHTPVTLPHLPIQQTSSIATVSRFHFTSKPSASSRIFWYPSNDSAITQKPGFACVEFWKDGTPSPERWAVMIPRDLGRDNRVKYVGTLASDLRKSEGGDYAKALHSFASHLHPPKPRTRKASPVTTRPGANSKRTISLSNPNNKNPSPLGFSATTTPAPTTQTLPLLLPLLTHLLLHTNPSFLHIAILLSRSPQSIIRLAKRLYNDQEFKTLLRYKKRGRWSKDEIQSLLKLWMQGFAVSKIALWMRRSEDGAERQLRGWVVMGARGGDGKGMGRGGEM